MGTESSPTLLSFYEVDLRNNEVIVTAAKKSRAWKDKIDGTLLLETTDMKSKPEDVVRRYKELAEIERGWRALKSSLMLRPVYHWTENRIRAHIYLCVMALQIERLMRNRLQSVSVRKAIDRLRRIKAGEMQVNGVKTRTLTQTTEEHQNLFKFLEVPTPRMARTRIL